MSSNLLKQFGNVPVSSATLNDILGGYSSPAMKVQLAEKNGELISLKRGLYMVSPEDTGKNISLGLVANHIYGPSYVSLEYALRHYGLIPEAVYTVTSVTTRHTRTFENSLGRFSYRCVSADWFPIGVTTEVENGVRYMIATPEKALCDTLLNLSGLPLRSVSGLATALEEDLRIDIDGIRGFDAGIVRECAGCGIKASLFTNLLKIIER